MSTQTTLIPAGYIPTVLSAELFAQNIEEIVRDGKLVRPDYKVIVFTEQGWTIDEEDKQYVKEVETVFIYNNNVQTYLCEITPSFYLIQCEYRLVLTEAGEALENEENGDILIDRLQQKYESPFLGGDDPNCYMHVSYIESMLESYRKDSDKGFHYGEVGDPIDGFNYTDAEYLDWLDDKHNDLEDAARECVTSGGLTWGSNKAEERNVDNYDND